MHLSIVLVDVTGYWKVTMCLTLNAISGSHFGRVSLDVCTDDCQSGEVTYIPKAMFAIGRASYGSQVALLDRACDCGSSLPTDGL
jgi:hypothetical protein